MARRCACNKALDVGFLCDDCWNRVSEATEERYRRALAFVMLRLRDEGPRRARFSDDWQKLLRAVRSAQTEAAHG